MAPTHLKTYVAHKSSSWFNQYPLKVGDVCIQPHSSGFQRCLHRSTSGLSILVVGPQLVLPVACRLASETYRTVELPELKPTVLLIKLPAKNNELWYHYSSFHKLLGITSWYDGSSIILESPTLVRNLGSLLPNWHLPKSKSYHYVSQILFLQNFISIKSSVHVLHPIIGHDGLLRVRGRLSKVHVSLSVNHPITKMLDLQVHQDMRHPELVAVVILAYVTGLQSLLSSVLTQLTLTCDLPEISFPDYQTTDWAAASGKTATCTAIPSCRSGYEGMAVTVVPFQWVPRTSWPSSNQSQLI